ncbi:hypothetical protein [Streptomyces cadmiisoli]|uniref:hypothetical protein n=1 Tax=Streptomyces cadmiisoli TaxID=2184053 RepID=UPI003D75E6B9
MSRTDEAAERMPGEPDDLQMQFASTKEAEPLAVDDRTHVLELVITPAVRVWDRPALAGSPAFKETALRRSALRSPMPITVLVLGLTLLTGCAIDKGTALAEDFERDWTGTPDVANIGTTKNNTLPFRGTSTGTLTLKDGTSTDRVTQLAGEMRDYVTLHNKITGRITADGVTFTVVADEERTGEVLALWRSMTADSQVTAADIHDAPWKEATDRWRIEVSAVDATSALTVFKDMLAEGDRYRPLAGVMVLKIKSPGLRIETDFHDSYPTEAIDAYEAVLARYAVVRATVRRDPVSGSAATIVVAGSEDRDHAGELARGAAPNLGSAITVTSDNSD